MSALTTNRCDCDGFYLLLPKLCVGRLCRPRNDPGEPLRRWRIARDQLDAEHCGRSPGAHGLRRRTKFRRRRITRRTKLPLWEKMLVNLFREGLSVPHLLCVPCGAGADAEADEGPTDVRRVNKTSRYLSRRKYYDTTA